MSEDMPDRMSDRMPDKMSEDMPDRMSIITLLRGRGGLNEIFHLWIPPHLYVYNQNHPLHRQEARIYGYRVMYTYII